MEIILLLESVTIGIGTLLLIFAVMNAINIGKLKNLMNRQAGIVKEEKVKTKNSFFSRIKIPKIFSKIKTPKIFSNIKIPKIRFEKEQKIEEKVYVQPHIPEQPIQHVKSPPIQPRPIQRPATKPIIDTHQFDHMINEPNEEEYYKGIRNQRKKEELTKDYEEKLKLFD